MDEKNITLKRKRSDSYKSNSLESNHSSKKFKGDKPHKKRFINNGNNKKKYNDSFSNQKSKIVYPNHYWFGGNMRDPLNLNGLIDNGGMSHSVTPLPSPPVTSPHRHDVLVPVAHAVNIYDPLNLCGEEEDDLFFKRRNRIRKRRHSTRKRRSKSRLNSLSDEATEGNVSTGSETKINEELPSFKVDDALLSKTHIHNSKRTQSDSQNEKSLSDKTVTKISKYLDCLKKEKSQIQIKSIPNATMVSPIDTHLNTSLNQQQDAQNSSSSSSSGGRGQCKSLRYIHGNYNTHGGYMNPEYIDARLEALPRRSFKGKEVLDVGCNVGHSTIMIALHFGVKHITGVDVDDKLVSAAKKNLLYHAGLKTAAAASTHSTCSSKSSSYSNLSPVKSNSNPFKLTLSPFKANFKHTKTPTTSSNSSHTRNLRTSYGNIINHPLLNLTLPSPHKDTPPTLTEEHPLKEAFSKFPHNVSFIHEDYAPLSSLEVQHQTPQYDVILALALTKHIHLKHGDQGLQLMFQKVHRQLRPGGSFIMQAQQWSSYKKHTRASETITSNYKAIKFFPSQFEQYLLSDSVGFSKCNHIADIRLPHKTKACQQFILEFIKGHSNNNNHNNDLVTTTATATTNSTTPTTTTSLPTPVAGASELPRVKSDVTILTSVISNVDSTSVMNTLDDDDEDDDGGCGDNDCKDNDDRNGDNVFLR